MVTTPLGDFGGPPDPAAWLALAASVLLMVTRRRLRSWRLPDAHFVALAAASAALLSSWYVSHYLHGGPRIIDATSYYLQGRALAEGYVGIPFGFPSGSFRGRFLLADATGGSLAGIFPPGYPALLALGFVVGAPLLVGPLLAAVVVVLTFHLARRLFSSIEVARLAALLSVSSGVLRYHTADTMSHGLAAALMSGALLAALGSRVRSAALAGLLAGWLVATRPPSGVVAFGVVAFLLRGSPLRVVTAAAAAAAPVLLFLLQQQAATGGFFQSTQVAYYALADGPPGCLRYGFGKEIGCLFEHGDFVRARFPDGFGFAAALGTTLRRVKMHLTDAANFEPFIAAVLYGLVVAWRAGPARALVLGVVGVVLAYVPFYFDANYPGGGARLYADVLPLEHVAMAAALAGTRLERLVLPAALAGFALHTSYDHGRLRDREGGRPLFEEQALVHAGVTRGLVFVDTDHGFLLGARPPRGGDGLVVARLRRDAHDALLWDALGRPPAYEYRISPASEHALPRVVPLRLDLRFPLRLEGEAEWPPLSVSGGWAVPDFPPCASGHRGLRLNPHRSGPVRVRVELPAPKSGRYVVRPGWATTSGPATPRIRVGGVEGQAALDPRGAPCAVGPELTVELRKGPNPVEITSEAAVVLDYLELQPAAPPPG